MRRSSLPLALAGLALAGCEGRCPFRPDPVEPATPPAPPAPPANPTPAPQPVPAPAPKPALAPATLQPEPAKPAEADQMSPGEIAGILFSALFFVWVLVALYRRQK